ncbi:protein GrpE [Caballeronia insecticola]|uniref:Protein GrpE n=2 Tax=Caballeronia insecticola TaxID=758793 RepID=R4WTC7_9BURK|nr:protein GrpE [Caballeronia insecticola]
MRKHGQALPAGRFRIRFNSQQYTFSDMENTQENSASQNPTPADETARQAADASQPAAAAAPADSAAPQSAQAAAAPTAGDSALAEAQATIAALKEDFLRAKAETENVRRRSQEDVAKAHKFAIENFAEHLLPVLDSLEAALADQSTDLAKVREGVELTLRQLTGALEKGRVVAVNPVGEKFDPHRHQAISMVPAEQDANTVVAVLQKGYVIADRVLRPALVTVAAPK